MLRTRTWFIFEPDRLGLGRKNRQQLPQDFLFIPAEHPLRAFIPKSYTIFRIDGDNRQMARP